MIRNWIAQVSSDRAYLSNPVSDLEAILTQNLGSVKTPNYASALAIFSLGAFIAIIIFAAIAREAKGVEFIRANEEVSTVGEMAHTG